MTRCLCRVAGVVLMATVVAGCGGSDKGVDKPDKPVPKPTSKAEVG